MRTFTRAPMTPKLVSRRYSKGRFLLTVLRNGYRYKGMWAARRDRISVSGGWACGRTGGSLSVAPERKRPRVSWCDATHCSNANALQTLFDACAVKVGGDSIGYMLMISCKRAETVPNECHRIGAATRSAWTWRGRSKGYGWASGIGAAGSIREC